MVLLPIELRKLNSLVFSGDSTSSEGLSIASEQSSDDSFSVSGDRPIMVGRDFFPKDDDNPTSASRKTDQNNDQNGQSVANTTVAAPADRSF